MRIVTIIASTLLLALGLSACATGPQNDPWARYNQPMFAGNKAVDQAMFEPVAKSYLRTAPQPTRNGVHNVLANLRASTDVLNNLLQGKPGGSVNTVSRFVINSTIGVGGIFDPAAEEFGIVALPEDFGQTLAVWGVGSGPYAVLPFFGPSNVRDAVGLVVDVVSHPLYLLNYQGATVVQLSRFGVNALDVRTGAIDLIDNLDENSLDEYAAYRSLYEQSRASAIRDGALDVDNLPDFDEYDDDE